MIARTPQQLREAARTGAMTPKQVLEAAQGITLEQDGYTVKLTLRPGLRDEEIEAVAHWPKPLPREIRELVQFARGFVFGLDDEVDFTARETMSSDYRFQVPLSTLGVTVPLHDDGDGRSVVDIDPATGAWRTVFLAVEEPRVFMVQAASITEWLLQYFEEQTYWSAPAAPPPPHMVIKDNIYSIAERNPELLSLSEARASSDAELREFASTLSDAFDICDLRAQRVGSGFTWGYEGQTTEVRRFGTKLLFAIEKARPQKPSLWRRLVGKRHKRIIVELK